jgi:hypothetical protein
MWLELDVSNCRIFKIKLTDRKRPNPKESGNEKSEIVSMSMQVIFYVDLDCINKADMVANAVVAVYFVLISKLLRVFCETAHFHFQRRDRWHTFPLNTPMYFIKWQAFLIRSILYQPEIFARPGME